MPRKNLPPGKCTAHPECERPIYNVGNMLCTAHYQYWRRTGNLTASRMTRSTPLGLTLRERYEREVIKNVRGCWGWKGVLDKNGYGMIEMSEGGVKTRRLAHRASFELHTGPLIDGLNVNHHCDTPSCTRPSHLYQGSQKENVHDMIRRGRADFRGLNNHG